MAAAKDIGLDPEKDIPHVYNTTDSDAQKQYLNEVAPAAGNSAEREKITALKNKVDTASNDILSSFNVTDREGKPLISEEGKAPTQTEMKKVVQDKINDVFQSNKDRVTSKYKAMDEESAKTGSKVSVPSYVESLSKVANWKEGDGDRPTDEAINYAKDQLASLGKVGAVGEKGYKEKYGISPATGAALYRDIPEKAGKEMSFSNATDMKESLNKAISDTNDRSTKRHLNMMKSSLMNDINESVERSGDQNLKSMWQDAEKDYSTTVAPIREHPGLKKYLSEARIKADPDKILDDLVKSDNPTAISRITSLIPNIKEDLGFLKLRSAGEKMNKRNNPEVSNALSSIGSMSDDAGVALFGPEKWGKIDSLKKVHGKLGDVLNYGSNPKTGAQAAFAKARSVGGHLGDLASATTALSLMAHGDLAQGLAMLLGKPLLNVAANKGKATLMTGPKGFELANSKMTPSQKKSLQSKMLAISSQLSSALSNNQGNQE